jgi:hypothetical protein
MPRQSFRTKIPTKAKSTRRASQVFQTCGVLSQPDKTHPTFFLSLLWRVDARCAMLRADHIMHRMLCLFLAAVSAQAAPIAGLFNTGVGTNGALLPTGAVDPHYRLIQSADPASPGPNAILVNDTLFPIVTGPWLASGPSSKWIAPKADQSGGSAAGNYTYRISFNLAGFDPVTAVLTGRWTSDNVGVDVLLNGVTTGVTGDGNFGTFGPTFTIARGSWTAPTRSILSSTTRAPPPIPPRCVWN